MFWVKLTLEEDVLCSCTMCFLGTRLTEPSVQIPEFRKQSIADCSVLDLWQLYPSSHPTQKFFHSFHWLSITIFIDIIMNISGLQTLVSLVPYSLKSLWHPSMSIPKFNKRTLILTPPFFLPSPWPNCLVPLLTLCFYPFLFFQSLLWVIPFPLNQKHVPQFFQKLPTIQASYLPVIR